MSETHEPDRAMPEAGVELPAHHASTASERKLRILIVSQYFWPETFRVNDFAAELIARGHEVTVLTGLPNYPGGTIFEGYKKDPSSFELFEGALVHRVPVIPRGHNGIRLMLNYLSFVLSGIILGPWKLRGRNFDAIFVFQTSPITSALPALLLRRIKRAPVLMWVLDLWPDTLSAVGVVNSPRLLRLIGGVVRFIYLRCDRILIQSRAFQSNVESYSQDAEKIRYFPGWAEPLFYGGKASVDPAPQLEAYADDFKVMFAGNLGKAQDLPSIIAAADLLRDEPRLRWIIVGDGRKAAEARAEVERRELSDKVIFLGRFPLEAMPSFFASADALLVSLAAEPIWSMTIPGKVQSYLASGRPLLGMLDGEGARIIEEAQAGLTGPAGDSATLAANVRALMASDVTRRNEYGDAGRAYCRREFDREILVDRFEQWVKELNDRRSGINTISAELIEGLSMRAARSPRRRQHFNLHADFGEPVQRLLNAIEPDSYIRPHRHSLDRKCESLVALRGRFALISFDEQGRIDHHVPFGTGQRDAVGVELAPGQWHTVVALEPGAVLLEVKQGPFDPQVAKEFAPWSPHEGSAESASYLASLHAVVRRREKRAPDLAESV